MSNSSLPQTQLILEDLINITKLPIGRILSLALDIPDLFDLSDKELGIKLLAYSDTLRFDNISYEEDDEEEFTY